MSTKCKFYGCLETLFKSHEIIGNNQLFCMNPKTPNFEKIRKHFVRIQALLLLLQLSLFIALLH